MRDTSAKNQNGADIPDKARFLNNINAASKTDIASKRGMQLCASERARRS